MADYVPDPKMAASYEFQFKNAKSNFLIRRGVGGQEMLFVKQGFGSLWTCLVPEEIWVARRCCLSSRISGHFECVLRLRRSGWPGDAVCQAGFRVTLDVSCA